MTLYHINVRIRLNSYAPYAWLFGEFWGCFTRLIKCPQQHCNFYSCSSACSSFFLMVICPVHVYRSLVSLLFQMHACTKFTCWALCAFYLYQFQFVGTLHNYMLKSWYYRTSLVHLLLVYFIVKSNTFEIDKGVTIFFISVYVQMVFRLSSKSSSRCYQARYMHMNYFFMSEICQ